MNSCKGGEEEGGGRRRKDFGGAEKGKGSGGNNNEGWRLGEGEGVQRGEGEVRGVKCHIYTCMGGEEVGEGGEGREEGEVTGGDWHCAVTGRRYSNNKKNQ